MAIRVSSPFGLRVHPVTGELRPHNGVDLAVPVGTALRASRAGKVVSVSSSSTGGLSLRLLDSYGFTWVYMHLDRVAALPGAWVAPGELLAWSGASGRVSGPHLHLELRTADGRPVDPIPYFPRGTFYGP